MLLKVYDQYKNVVGNIRKYTDLVIERELESGDKTLSFTYQEKNPELIQNEYYIETPDDRYVVKEIGISSDGYPDIVCQLDLETLEAEMVESFSAIEVSIQEAANLALVGTGWRADTEGIDPEKLRSVATLKATPLTLLGKIRDAWMCELKYDSKNQIVYFRDQFGEDKGVFFSKELNLRKLKLTDDSYDYYTRIVPIGEDDLRINDVNDGVGYVENYQYSNKVRTLIWEDTSYTDAEALKEDAEAKLDDMSKPARSYSADVVDLAKERPEYKIMDFDLGDTITLLDQDSGIKDKQRIVKLKEYPDDPFKNSCELSNTTWTWEELQSKLQAAADAFEDITNSDGTVNGYYVHGVTSDGVVVIETIIGPDGSTTTTTTSLTDALNETANNLDAVTARIGTLEVTALTVTEADILYAKIGDLDVVTADIQNLYGLYADISSIIADEIAARVANIENVLAGNVGTGNLESIVITTENAYIEDAVIVNALMDTVLASVLTAGIIYTDYIKIADNDGQYLWIDGSTLQFKDENGTVRVQIGLDESGNYNYYLWDENGTLIWDPLGLTEAGLIGNGAIIKDEAVADDANISGYKLNIEEVTQILNDEGQLIMNATQVIIDGETLDYRLTQITQQIEGLEGFEGVESVENYYALGGADEPPCDPGEEIIPSILGEIVLGETKLGCIGWTTDRLVADKGEYLWYVQKVTYSNGDVKWTTPTLITDDYIRTAVSIQQTELEVVQGQISAKIWMTDIESAVNSFNDTIDTITNQYGELTVLVDTIDERVGYLSTTVSTYYEELSSQVTSLTLELDNITAQVTDVYERTGSAITEGTPYYAVSTNPNWYPPHESSGNDTSILGEMVLGEAVLGFSGDDWTTEQPEYQEGQYIWISYFRERVDGTTYWTDPTLLTDEWTRESVSIMSDRYAEIVLNIDSIIEEVSNVWTVLAGEYYTASETSALIAAYVERESSEILLEVSQSYVDRGELSSAIEEVEAETGLAVINVTPYFAESPSATEAPDHEDHDDAALFGEAVFGEATIGRTIGWTTEQPEAGEYMYIWMCYLMETKDGSLHWSSPILMTDEWMKNNYITATEANATIDAKVEAGLATIDLTVSGSLGGVASIKLSSGDKTKTQELDLSNVRQAFADDGSSVIISAGTIAFNSNSLLINASNCVLDENGVISVTNGVFSGTVTTSSGNLMAVLEGGGLRLYYKNVEYARLYSSSFMDSDVDTVRGAYFSSSNEGKFLCFTYYEDGHNYTAYIINNGLNPSGYTERNIFYGYTRAIDSVYLNAYMHMSYGYSIRSYNSSGSYINMMILTDSESYSNVLAIGDYTNKSNRIQLWGYYIYSYVSITQGSDRALKHDVEPLDDKYLAMFDEMEPVRFKRNNYEKVEETEENGNAEIVPMTARKVVDDNEITSKYHTGYIAQDVIKAAEDAGLTEDEVGLYSKDTGDGYSGLAYEEIIPLLHLKIKQLENRIEQLEGERAG